VFKPKKPNDGSVDEIDEIVDSSFVDRESLLDFPGEEGDHKVEQSESYKSMSEIRRKR
jgi:hypothetical protein